MANTATLTNSKTQWGGGNSPFNVSYGKLMMWIFLLSDAFTFSSLLVAYGFIRYSFNGDVANPWPSPDMVFNHFPFTHAHLPLMFVSLMTFILIFSSVTMVLAVEAGHRNSRKEVVKYMIMTILGGAAFLGCQAWEWTHFIAGTEQGKTLLDGTVIKGANLFQNEYGPVAFADLFFIVTGFHGFHVFSGVVLNIIITIQAASGEFDKRGHYEMVEKVGLYWHFVDLVWVFVFTFYYLI
ncbi:MAG: cytochrome c oxidase subunit 3 [Bacteroidia bacterium]|jgi:cytochrome c oxidase subunit 3|nr:cytochrome c oxidase subunit 3 [Bacteroidia bacterium]